jgi:WRKY transcription factor 33
MGTSETPQTGVKDEQRQYTDFTFQTAAPVPETTVAGAAHCVLPAIVVHADGAIGQR